jgi:hypothetical protein
MRTIQVTQSVLFTFTNAGEAGDYSRSDSSHRVSFRAPRFTIHRLTGAALFFCLSLVFGFSQPARAQTVVAASRSVDWRSAGISGGIPSRTTVCTTLNPGATAAQINGALSACPSGQTVKLNAGTYNVAGIDFGGGKSNVTLRGAGADKTFLVFSGATSCNGLFADVCMHSSDTNWRGGPSNSANWTAGYAKGATSITLSSAANLAVGKTIILDQLDDSSDNGSIYVCQTVAGGCNDDGPSGGPSGGQRSGRAQQQLVTVTAISGNQVTISPGLYMPNWRASQSPGAWWASDPASSDGVEDISLDHSNSDGTYGIGAFNCNGCWVKGVRSINSTRGHVHAQVSARLVVRDSYFFGTKNAQSQSYGVEVFPSGDALIENNIFQHVTAPVMVNASCSGCVLAYNYSINDYYVPTNYLSHSVFLHAGGIDNVLIEGNVGAGLYSDLFHGTHHFVTVFRNRYNGWESGRTDNLHAVNLWPFSRFFNIVGNVLGESGRQNTYDVTPSSSGSQPIYMVGTGTVNCCSAGDANVATTLLRWGNYDTVTGAAKFASSEVPSSLGGGQAPYANPVPSSQTLPASLYQSAKPAWWPSAKPWPAIGPDVNGGNIPNVAGHAYSVPAQDCYSSVMSGPADGSGNVLSFNAAACYAQGAPSGTAPAAPTNPRIISGL